MLGTRLVVGAFVLALAVAGGCGKKDSDSDRAKSAKPAKPAKASVGMEGGVETRASKGGNPSTSAGGPGLPGTASASHDAGHTPAGLGEAKLHEPPGPARESLDLLSSTDYIEDAQLLARAGACSGDVELPDTLPPKYVRGYCKRLDKAIAAYRRRWLDKARPFFHKLVPSGLPQTIVYPFAGADLLSVLAVVPKANDITTLSLEPAGDPRPLKLLPARRLQRSLSQVGLFAAKLLRISHNRTVDMSEVMTWGKLPGHIIFTLVGLRIHGFEPVSMRYFLVERAGGLRYIHRNEVDSLAAAPNNKKQAVSHRNLPHRLKPWANVEITFRKQGDVGGDVRVYRHIRANLHNGVLDVDDRVVKHLETKGRVTAMTKAASYLLWRSSFSSIRRYLLERMEWMVSDATGVPPEIARKAGFEQLTYGQWNRPIRDSNIKPDRVEQMKRFWTKNRVGSVPFLFGYPAGPGGLHLMVTRPRSAR